MVNKSISPQRLKEAIQAVEFLLQQSAQRYPKSLPPYHLSRINAWREGVNTEYITPGVQPPSYRIKIPFSELNLLRRELEIYRSYAEALLVQEQLKERELRSEEREELTQRALGIIPSSEARRFAEIHSCPGVQPRHIAESATKLLESVNLIAQELGPASALAYGMLIIAGLRARAEFEKYGQRLDELFNRVVSAPEVARVLELVELDGRPAGFEPQFRLLLGIRERLWQMKPHRFSSGPSGYLLTKVIDAYLSNRPGVGNIIGLTVIDSIVIGKLGFPVRYVHDSKSICIEVLINNRSVYWDPGAPVPLSFTPIISGKRLELSDLMALVYASIANTCFSQALWDKAIENYQRALELFPDSPETYRDMAVCYMRKNLPDKAIKTLESALKLSPNSATIHHILGNAYAMANQYRQSIISYKKAVQLSPKFPEAWYNMGLAYEKMGMSEQAVAAFQMTIEINPEYCPAYLALGNIYLEQGKVQDSIRWYREAIKHDPNLVSAYYNLGRAYYEGKDLDNAINCYQKAIKLNPKHAGAWYNLGIAYRDKGQKNKAVEALEQAVALNPNLLR